MNYEDVRTRFATYECLRLSRETRFIPNDAPVLLEVDIGEPIYLPPPWERKRQSLIDRFYAVLSSQAFLEYSNSLLEDRGLERISGPLCLRSFRTLNDEAHLPKELRAPWLSHLDKSYFIILQIGGLIYDLCRLIRPAGESGILGIYSGLKNYFSDTAFITESEWSILLVITRLYYELTALWEISSRQFAHLLASQSTVSVTNLFWILQAIGVSYEGISFLPRFDQVRWHLDLIIGRIQIPRQISRLVADPEREEGFD